MARPAKVAAANRWRTWCFFLWVQNMATKHGNIWQLNANHCKSLQGHSESSFLCSRVAKVVATHLDLLYPFVTSRREADPLLGVRCSIVVPKERLSVSHHCVYMLQMLKTVENSKILQRKWVSSNCVNTHHAKIFRWRCWHPPFSSFFCHCYCDHKL